MDDKQPKLKWSRKGTGPGTGSPPGWQARTGENLSSRLFVADDGEILVFGRVYSRNGQGIHDVVDAMRFAEETAMKDCHRLFGNLLLEPKE